MTGLGAYVKHFFMFFCTIVLRLVRMRASLSEKNLKSNLGSLSLNFHNINILNPKRG